MKKITLTTLIPVIVLVFFTQIGFSQSIDFEPQVFTSTKPMCVYYEGDYNGLISVPRSQEVIEKMSRNGAPCSDIFVTYNGFTPQAQAAFQFAVDIWAMSIETTVPIRINANFAPLNPGVLGQAGPSNFRTSNAPGALPNVFYPNALWEKLEGQDSDGAAGVSNDINCTFSSTFNFYFGTDANPPNNQADFVSVVLHELGHGLGFIGFGTSNGINGSIRINGNPSVFDTFIQNSAGISILTFADPSPDLHTQMTGGNLFCNSAAATAENGGILPRTHAPGTFVPGSSYSHWDEVTFPAGNVNSLMSPQIANGEANHNPGPITLGYFEDMGWTLCSTLSVEDFNVSSVEVSPNPFTSLIAIKLTNSSNANFTVNLIDINGRVVLTETKTATNNNFTLSNLDELEDALYFVKITNDSGASITKKVIKN